MLVLAMEFSRDTQRALGSAVAKEQTGVGAQNGRARGRQSHLAVSRRRRVGGLDSPRAARRAGTEGHSLKTE